MKNYELVSRDAFAKLANPEAKTVCRALATALEVEDKSVGAKAFQAFNLQCLFNEGKITEYKDYATMMREVFKVERAQAFNLARAGSLLIEGIDEKTKRKYFTDVFTNDFNKRPFSNTALVRIAEFIGDDDTSESRRNMVYEYLKNGEISQEMSVAKIMEKLRGTTTKKPKNDPPKNDPPENDPPKNDPPENDLPENDPPKTDKITLALEMTAEEWANLRSAVIMNIDKKGKENGYIKLLLDAIDTALA